MPACTSPNGYAHLRVLLRRNNLESREPSIEDLRDLCRDLNARGAEQTVIGGFAFRAAVPAIALTAPRP